MFTNVNNHFTEILTRLVVVFADPDDPADGHRVGASLKAPIYQENHDGVALSGSDDARSWTETRLSSGSLAVFHSTEQSRLCTALRRTVFV